MAIIIHDGKYRVSTDGYHRVIITEKHGSYIESHTVEALLLLEIIRLLSISFPARQFFESSLNGK